MNSRLEVYMQRSICRLTLIIGCLLLLSIRAEAQLSGTVNFVVLRVTFSDFGTGTRFTTAQAQANFNKIATLWGNQTSYGAINIQYQFAGPSQVASSSGTYLDDQGGQSSTTAGILQLISDAVAASPNTINWNNVYGLVVLFGDTRMGGFYRGITLPSTTSISPPSGGNFNVHASIVGENPGEDVATSWGRWAHEMGHQMQANPGNPWHPSNYNSDFEQMDAEYPGQSGMFFKQSNLAWPGWMPASKYKTVSPPQGASVGLYAEEQPPSSQPDFQAIKAFLTFGGPQVYYMISVRRAILGDDAATKHGPHGIPDEGVLIERIVEGGNPNIDDCAPNGCFRWAEVRGNGSPDKLWHVGDVYKNQSDGIFITVRFKPDADHYIVDVDYADKAGQPDVGMNSWLQPPGNTYETTDIWVDSPVNGYGTFRYSTWSDLMGGTVPVGNGDDPAVGQANRLYARVRNFGTMPAANIVVHFDITDPPGLGINGSNGFIQLGTVDKNQFPALALLQPGQSTDVYIEWTPNFTLTPDQIQQGRFAFHTCVRVRIDQVAGETFLGNQDGDGEQENIQYFQATSPGGGAPGAPGEANKDFIHLRNDSPALPKEFFLSVSREKLPKSWKVSVNNGQQVVKLGPGELRDIPVVVQQTQQENIGARYSIKVFASSRVTLKNSQRPKDYHEGFKSLGGVRFQVAVLRATKLNCVSSGGVVKGTISGLDPKDERVSVYVAGVSPQGKFMPKVGALASVQNGRFEVKAPSEAKYGVCMYAGSQYSASAGTKPFPIQ
jgi:hypothetical protein